MELCQVITIRVRTATLMRLSEAVNAFNRENPDAPTTLGELTGSMVHVDARRGTAYGASAVHTRRREMATSRHRAETTPPNTGR